MSFVDELKRRNVFRVSVAYVIVAWLLLQVSDTLAPALLLPDWFLTAVAFLLILGFPLALFFAWAYQLTPDGFKKEKDITRRGANSAANGRQLDFVVIGLLVVALAYFGYDKYILDPERDAENIEAAVRTIQDQSLSIADSPRPTKSIAVLAFVNMSDDPGNDYFAEGISEEILNLLAKEPELRVTSRSSAFSLKGQNLDVPTIATKLDVDHVLEGSVRKSGNRLRITTQLIDAVTDSHLWSETYDRELVDVFAIQDEIAIAVEKAMQITLLGGGSKAIDIAPEAYALFLQGRHFVWDGTLDDLDRAETLLQEALALAPDYVPALIQLGFVYMRQGTFTTRPIDEGFELARDAIGKAMAMDPQNGRAWAMLARINLFYDWDFEAADLHVRQALDLSSGDVQTLDIASWLALVLGQVDDAVELSRKVVARDPLSPVGQARLSSTYFFANRLEEALDSARMAISLSPGRSSTNYGIGLILLAEADAPAALAAMERENTEGFRLTGLAMAHHALHDTEASDAALNELIDKHATTGPAQIAEVYAFRGDVEAAFFWLDKAVEYHDGGILYMQSNPVLTALHDDPRWETILNKMGL